MFSLRQAELSFGSSAEKLRQRLFFAGKSANAFYAGTLPVMVGVSSSIDGR
jgi:hypothetical protein